MSRGPSTWEAAAHEALESIVPDGGPYYHQEYLLEYLTQYFESGDPFEYMGRMAVLGWLVAKNKRFHVEDQRGIVNVLASKQHDYGHDNILKHGVEGVRVRMWDKIARLKNLLTRGTEAKNESIIDTWFDLIGYSVIGVMLERGTFQLPLLSDVRPVSGDRYRVTDPMGGTYEFDPDESGVDGRVFGPLKELLNGGLGITSVTIQFDYYSMKYELAL